MEEDGLWRLFFLTGMPEIWLTLRGLQNQLQIYEYGSVPAFFQSETEKTEC